jgi:hypothetical protein
MKKIELIIPESKLKDAHAILINVNSGGMSYYRPASMPFSLSTSAILYVMS